VTSAASTQNGSEVKPRRYPYSHTSSRAQPNGPTRCGGSTSRCRELGCALAPPERLASVRRAMGVFSINSAPGSDVCSSSDTWARLGRSRRVAHRKCEHLTASGNRPMKSAPSSSRQVGTQLQLTSNTPFSQVAPTRASWNQLVQGKHRTLRIQLRKLTLAATSVSSR
jgi:hypothetical protein